LRTGPYPRSSLEGTRYSMSKSIFSFFYSFNRKRNNGIHVWQNRKAHTVNDSPSIDNTTYLYIRQTTNAEHLIIRPFCDRMELESAQEGRLPYGTPKAAGGD